MRFSKKASGTEKRAKEAHHREVEWNGKQTHPALEVEMEIQPEVW